MKNKIENEDQGSNESKKNKNPGRFLIKRPSDSAPGDILDDQSASTLFTLDWTFGFYEKDSDERSYLRNSLLPEVSKTNFDRDRFLNLLAFSFSLSLKEKERVLRSFSDTGLSEYQILELINTFEDEQREFDRLLATEPHPICQLFFRSLDSWAKLMWGKYHGSQKLILVLKDLVTIDTKIPSLIKRDSHFWKVATDHAVSWGSPHPILELLLDKGQASTDGKIPFPLQVVDFLYKTDLNLVDDRLSYISQRVQAAQICLQKSIKSKKAHMVLARAWAMGVCQDWILLDDEKEALKAISNSESSIKLAGKKPLEKDEDENEDEEFYSKRIKESETAILSWKIKALIFFNRSDKEIIRELNKLSKKIEESEIPENVIDALYARFQFPIACRFLFEKFNKLTSDDIPKERLHSFEAADVAAELLIISNIIDDIEQKHTATLFLLGFCQRHLLLGSPGSHEHQKWRCLYRSIKILNWIGYIDQEDLQPSAADITEVMDAFKAFGEKMEMGLYPPLSSDSSTEFVSKFRQLSSIQIAILCMEGLTSNNKDLSEIWRKSITDRRILFQVIVVLFSLSSNPEIRPITQSLARDLLDAADKGLFGPGLQNSLQMFGKFSSKLSYCGSKKPFDRNPYYWKDVSSYD